MVCVHVVVCVWSVWHVYVSVYCSMYVLRYECVLWSLYYGMSMCCMCVVVCVWGMFCMCMYMHVSVSVCGIHVCLEILCFNKVTHGKKEDLDFVFREMFSL